MNMIAVSVIIPVFNTRKYVYHSVMSALEQANVSAEIILVDDGSTDGAAVICDELSESTENIIAVHKPNGGLSSARNTGIELADGKYILFLDSDDELTPNALNELTTIAERTSADIVIPDRYIKTFENSNRKKLIYHFGKRFYISDPVGFAMHVMMEKGRAWRATALLYRRSCICDNAVRFPVGRTSEDMVFNLRLLRHIKKMAFYNKPTLCNLVRAGSISHSYDPKYMDTILFIDDEARNFLDTACVTEREISIALHSLLMGNTAVFLTAVMDPSNDGFCYKQQKETFRGIVNSARIREARKTKGLKHPYFSSKVTTAYIRIMYLLIKYGWNTIAARLACLSNVIRGLG